MTNFIFKIAKLIKAKLIFEQIIINLIFIK